jgi:hypothetical protein
MGVFKPGDHGSALAATAGRAVGIAALDVLADEKLERAATMGDTC